MVLTAEKKPSDILIYMSIKSDLASNQKKTDTQTRLSHVFSAKHIFAIMRARGHTPRLTPKHLAAAIGLANVGIDHAKLVHQTKMFFSAKAILVPKGLETVPPCWLSQLPRILLSTCKPHWDRIPYFITALAATEGVLAILFAQDDADIPGWDNLRVDLNLALFPNLWNPLRPRLGKPITISNAAQRPPSLRQYMKLRSPQQVQSASAP